LTNNPKNQQFESCRWSWERENGERERKKIEPNCADADFINILWSLNKEVIILLICLLMFSLKFVSDLELFPSSTVAAHLIHNPKISSSNAATGA